MQHAHIHQGRDEAVGWHILDPQHFHGLADGNCRCSVKIQDKLLGILRSAAQLDDLGVEFPPERKNTLERLLAAFGGLDNRMQKETHPVADVVGFAHAGQGVVVRAAMLFQMGGKIEGRLVQQPMANQIQGDQQAADPAVAIQKRVDGFKLIVAQCTADQVGGVNTVVRRLKGHGTIIGGSSGRSCQKIRGL
jgi:hypothetical protein